MIGLVDQKMILDVNLVSTYFLSDPAYIRRYLRYDLQLLERTRQIPKRTCLYHPVPVINCVSLGCSHMQRRLLSRMGRQREIKEETHLSGLDA